MRIYAGDTQNTTMTEFNTFRKKNNDINHPISEIKFYSCDLDFLSREKVLVNLIRNSKQRTFENHF